MELHRKGALHLRLSMASFDENDSALEQLRFGACLIDLRPECNADAGALTGEDQRLLPEEYLTQDNSFFYEDHNMRYSEFTTSNDYNSSDGFTMPVPYNDTMDLFADYDTNYHESDTVRTYNNIQHVLMTRVMVAICFFGLVGNIFNLLILIPKGLQYSMGRIEKFANSGLIALAVSDLCFCVMVIPHAFVNLECHYSDGITFTLLYTAYSNALINVFTMASTWLTVTLAIGRYLATCHPLRAREMIGMTIMKWSIMAVCVLCLLLNIPRFWTYRLEHADCASGQTVYFNYPGYLQSNRTFPVVYSWLYFVMGTVIPLILLTFCNTYLIRALRNSRATRRLIRAGDTSETSRYITMTLVAIVVMYIALVSPAELINFAKSKLISSHDLYAYKYNLAVAVVNTLQAINFSFNFVLYCVINASFRRSFVRMMCCLGKNHWPNRPNRSRPGSFSTSYTFRAQQNGTRATVHSFKLTEI